MRESRRRSSKSRGVFNQKESRRTFNVNIEVFSLPFSLPEGIHSLSYFSFLRSNNILINIHKRINILVASIKKNNENSFHVMRDRRILVSVLYSFSLGARGGKKEIHIQKKIIILRWIHLSSGFMSAMRPFLTMLNEARIYSI